MVDNQLGQNWSFLFGIYTQVLQTWSLPTEISCGTIVPTGLFMSLGLVRLFGAPLYPEPFCQLSLPDPLSS